VAEPRRRQILDVLAGGERPVNDLVRLLGLSQPLVSQPLVSKHLVYKAWSTPELVKRWWSGKPRRDDARRDRPSGWGRVAIRDGDGGRIVEVAFHGEYREIFPDERIISTEVYEGMPGGEALNTVMFTEAEGRGRARKGAPPSRSSCSTRARRPATRTHRLRDGDRHAGGDRLIGADGEITLR
jgi:uncharacterized protein YndB with AHSA1/START domain